MSKQKIFELPELKDLNPVDQEELKHKALVAMVKTGIGLPYKIKEDCTFEDISKQTQLYSKIALDFKDQHKGVARRLRQQSIIFRDGQIIEPEFPRGHQDLKVGDIIYLPIIILHSDSRFCVFASEDAMQNLAKQAKQ